MNSCADSLTNVLMTMHTFVATRCIMPNFATTCNVIGEEKEKTRGKRPMKCSMPNVLPILTIVKRTILNCYDTDI